VRGVEGHRRVTGLSARATLCWSPDYPGMAGGSMTAYGWIGHFRGRPPGTSVTGVEQIMLSQITAML
jgi:hypothetical protein